MQILEGGEEDLETIAGEYGYTQMIGREWRDVHCKAVLGYMRAIHTDYESSLAANIRASGKRCLAGHMARHRLKRVTSL